jgi:hypothetical protein
MTTDETLVRVRAAWNSWHTAEVRVGDLSDVHWTQPAGAPRPIIHASISCTGTLADELPHRCSELDDGHRISVCLLKHDCVTPVYLDLALRAEAPPLRQTGRERASAASR